MNTLVPQCTVHDRRLAHVQRLHTSLGAIEAGEQRGHDAVCEALVLTRRPGRSIRQPAQHWYRGEWRTRSCGDTQVCGRPLYNS